jgi:hypothetical protein
MSTNWSFEGTWANIISLEILFSDEAIVCLNVLCLCVKNWVLGNLHTPLIIDMNCNSSTCDWSDFFEKVIEANLLL